MKIGVVCVSGLGNAILFTPALLELQSVFPDAEIHLVAARPSVQEYFAHAPGIRCHLLPGSARHPIRAAIAMIPALARLRFARFDILLSTFPSRRWQHDAVVAALGGRKRIGFRYAGEHAWWKRWVYSDLVDADADAHDVINNRRLVEALEESNGGAGNEEMTLGYWSSDAARAEARAALSAAGVDPASAFTVYHPGGFDDMKFKRWPPERFAELIDRISAGREMRHVLLGVPQEVPILEAIRRSVRTPVAIVAGQPILTVAEIVRHARLMVSNDSGLMHVAAAVGTPVIGLFGPTNPSRTAPWSRRAFAVRSPSSVRGCWSYPFTAGQGECCGGAGCMSSITASQVFECIERETLRDNGSSQRDGAVRSDRMFR